MVATQWLLSLYVNALPTETVLRVWDIFFLDGREALMRVALAMFLQAKDDIVNSENSMEVVKSLNSVLIAAFDADSLLAAAYGNFAGVNNDHIAVLTRQAHTELYADQAKMKQKGEIRTLVEATHFETHELHAMLDDFVTAVGGGEDGKISDMETLTAIVMKNSPSLSAECMPLVYRAFDLNQDQEIDFRELMHGLSTLCRGTTGERIEMAFRCYDTSRTGTLDQAEVKAMVTFLLRSQYTVPLAVHQGGHPMDDIIDQHVFKIFQAVHRYLLSNYVVAPSDGGYFPIPSPSNPLVTLCVFGPCRRLIRTPMGR